MRHVAASGNPQQTALGIEHIFLFITKNIVSYSSSSLSGNSYKSLQQDRDSGDSGTGGREVV